MIKVYKIQIGEKVYEVKVESVTEVNGTINTPTQTEVKPVSNAVSGGTKVEAPMQGLVMSIDVNVGDKVSAGDTLAVLEAMKMENPIVAPVDGTIASILVNKGDTVDGGTVIITLS